MSLFVCKHTSEFNPLLNFFTVFNLSAYVPDALLPQYEAVRDGLLTWFKTFGLVKGNSNDASAGAFPRQTLFSSLYLMLLRLADTSRAKQALNDAENALRSVTKEKSQSEEELTRLFDPTWFGREGEFKKLQGTCLEKNTGE